jgi:DNA invertase Pin-like site-specific DNA recombinase
MVVGIMACIAQGERKLISQRTTAALQAAKRRGVKLGNPNGAAHLHGIGNRAAVRQVREDASARADSLRDIVEDVRAAGIVTVRGIADEMNRRGILTPRGAGWHPTSVVRLLERLTA